MTLYFAVCCLASSCCQKQPQTGFGRQTKPPTNALGKTKPGTTTPASQYKTAPGAPAKPECTHKKGTFTTTSAFEYTAFVANASNGYRSTYYAGEDYQHTRCVCMMQPHAPAHASKPFITPPNREHSAVCSLRRPFSLYSTLSSVTVLHPVHKTHHTAYAAHLHARESRVVGLLSNADPNPTGTHLVS